jgi:hypothetical protein
MALRKDELLPPKILRAHRPRTSDAVQVPDSDVQPEAYTEPLPKRPGLLAAYWRYLLAGACLMLGFYLLMSRIVLPFVVAAQEHWNYGASRVSVYDLNVGHGGVSHFITEYYRNQIIVIEMPVSDPGKSHIYALAESLAGNSSQHVVSLSTAYVSHSAQPGKPDLLVSVSGAAIPLVLYNTGDAFKSGGY